MHDRALPKRSNGGEPGPVRADFLVELRGFEPMAIADVARSRAIPLLPVNARRLFAARLLDLDLRPRLGRLSSASARHWSGPLFDKKNRPRAALRNGQLA
jgi:hypothetical protein